MKIGILTFHRAHNYGAVLQAFALQEYIKAQGHEVFFLDYNLDYVNQYYKWFNKRKIIRKNIFAGVKEVLRLTRRKKRYDSFNYFITNNFELLQLRDINLDKTLDFLIVGSDQLWNYVLTGGFNNLYWGNIPTYSKPKITYAISMEVVPQSDELKREIKLHLDNFNEISVRENKLKDILQPLTNKDIKVCLDPTMLVSANVWDKIIGTPIVKGPYVFLYQVRPSEKAENIALKIAEMYKCKVVKLYANADINSDSVCFSAGPSEFLNLIKYAKHVVSVSFHGTILPMIFHVPFSSVLLDDGKDERVLSILKELGLENMAISNPDTILLPKINWSLVDLKIQKLRKESEKYLHRYV